MTSTTKEKIEKLVMDDTDDDGHDDDEHDDDDENTYCSLGGWRPGICQRFANIASFTGINSVVALVMSTLSAYMSSQIPTLEKQFGMSSYETGIMMSFNDIGYLSCCLFVTSLARYVHIPRFLFYCGICFGVSGLMCTLPHFLTPRDVYMSSLVNNNVSVANYDVSNNITVTSQIPMCIMNDFNGSVGMNENCLAKVTGKYSNSVSSQSELKTMALALIAVGMLFQGAGKAPRSAFLTVYIDDNTDKRKTGFYMGIISCAAIMGMAMAYGLGAVFSRLFVTLESVDISPRDPRWIGAWWLGFMTFGIASVVVVIPFLCFPRRLKTSAKEKKKNKEFGSVEALPTTTREKIKDRVLSYYRVLRNIIYASCLVSNLSQYIALVGHFAFLSKYIVSQWGVTLWKANIILSASNLVSLAVGAFIGGLITRKVSMTPRNTFGCIFGLLILHTILFIFGFFLGCEQPYVVGPKSIHGDHALLTVCSEGCNCNGDEFFPICGSDGATYHSPCFAGCSLSERKGTIYSNCTCIPDGMATAGQCSFSECKTLYPWAAVNFASSLVAAVIFLVAYIAKLRCVKDKDKATAMGLEAFLASLIALIPVPIVFGKLVDTCCMIWQTTCKSRGACLFYNIVDYRYKVHAFCCAFKVISILVILFALVRTWRWTNWRKSKTTESQANNELIVNNDTSVNNKN